MVYSKIFLYFVMMLEKMELNPNSSISISYRSNGSLTITFFKESSDNCTLYFNKSDAPARTEEKMNLVERFIIQEIDFDKITLILSQKGVFY